MNYALTVACPHCGAARSKQCTVTSGTPKSGASHLARRKLAAARGELVNMNLHVVLRAGAPAEYFLGPLSRESRGIRLGGTPRAVHITLPVLEVFQAMSKSGLVSLTAEGIAYTSYCMLGGVVDSRWAIVRSRIPGDLDNYRVVDLRSGEESALYTREQCAEIIAAARAGAILGSFALST